MAPQEVPGAALAGRYDIPDCTLHRKHARLYVLIAVVLLGFVLYRHVEFIGLFSAYRPLMIAWTLAAAFSALQWLLSWRDRPWTVTRAQRYELDQLCVVVNFPIYNEDPVVVDRALYALMRQTRPVQIVHVVDDGSSTDYSVLQEYWERTWGATEVVWTKKGNGGKKSAQVATFSSHPQADVFVTIDSDTACVANAIEEGMKPLADPDVWSVAGIELAFNSGVNWLTRTVSARSLFFQVVACGAQSALGDILVNRGAFALYRAQLLRDTIPAYTRESFLGMTPVKLGDDAALTLFARGRGKAVQQSTAFALTMYPEKLSHHLRQWLRWMRGSTIRNCWRVRYLPVRSYGWWFTVLGIYMFLASTALPVLIAATWPESSTFAEGAVVAMLAWAYLTALRILSVRRSDENWAYRIVTTLCYPPAMLWSALVLRPIRYLGIATYRRQGWTTRTDGAEVGITETIRERVAA
jgi:hyaluronan synthase